MSVKFKTPNRHNKKEFQYKCLECNEVFKCGVKLPDHLLMGHIKKNNVQKCNGRLIVTNNGENNSAA